MKPHVLVTGSSGHIGQIIVPHLQAEGVRIRGIDQKYNSDLVDEFIHGDLADLALVRRAVSGVSLVIHLGAISNDDAALSDLIAANLIGVHNVLEAIRLTGIHNVVLASSIQVVDIFSEGVSTWQKDQRCPTSVYGLLKITAEDMGNMYYRMHGINCIAARLGWTPKSEIEFLELESQPILWSTYLSNDDLCQFFSCCIQRKFTGFQPIYVVSRQSRRPHRFDTVTAKKLLGYEPRDSFHASKLGVRRVDQT